MAEADYVFLQQNTLPDRWSRPLQQFVIAETGFGTGLNFLLASQLWNQCQFGQSVLHYISTE
ncbi:MAG: hypothetical protein ACR2PS_03020, partial [Pseudomonadales bacterium]